MQLKNGLRYKNQEWTILEKKVRRDPVERDIARGLPHVNLQAETEALTFINRHSHIKPCDSASQASLDSTIFKVSPFPSNIHSTICTHEILLPANRGCNSSSFFFYHRHFKVFDEPFFKIIIHSHNKECKFQCLIQLKSMYYITNRDML